MKPQSSCQACETELSVLQTVSAFQRSSLHFDVDFVPDVRDLVFDFATSSKRLCQPIYAGPSALMGPEPLPKEEKAPLGFAVVSMRLTSCWQQRDDGCC